MLIKETSRPQLIRWLGPLAQLALVGAIALGRLENPELDFVIGALTGFSLVGNLCKCRYET